MLPSSAVAVASLRLLHLLRTSSISHVWRILRTDPKYTDLTQSQYAIAFDLLKETGALVGHTSSLALAKEFAMLPERQIRKQLFECIIRHVSPAWLQDADILVPASGEIPEDAAKLATGLGLMENEAFQAVKNAHAHADLEKRKLIGDAGERALLAYLEANCPDSTIHVAAVGDGFGYDIAFEHGGREWHLEVKSTTRRGRMTFFLSRNEYETSLADPSWRLVVAGLSADFQLMATATLLPGHLQTVAPVDASTNSKWQSAMFEMSGSNFVNGICLSESSSERVALHSYPQAAGCQDSWFAWLP
jgi:hypothetical protein